MDYYPLGWSVCEDDAFVVRGLHISPHIADAKHESLHPPELSLRLS